MIGEKAMGTIPRALVLQMGDVATATLAFDEIIDPEVKRVALVDTLVDEKFEAVKVAEALWGRLSAVRLDTPSHAEEISSRLFRKSAGSSTFADFMMSGSS